MRFLPAPQVIFDLLFSVKPTPNTAKTNTEHRENLHQNAHQVPQPRSSEPLPAPPISAHAPALPPARTPARAYYIYIIYLYHFPARMRSPPRLCAHTCTPPRSPAPLRTRFYLFPFIYDLLFSISPLFKIYFPFFSSLYDLFIMLYIVIFYMIYMYYYIARMNYI